jgi:hypothetical protein
MPVCDLLMRFCLEQNCLISKQRRMLLLAPLSNTWMCNTTLSHTSYSRPRHRWADDIKMKLTGTGWECVDWIHLAQGRDQWRVHTDTVMNVQLDKRRKISWLAERHFASQEGLLSMEFSYSSYLHLPLQ